MTFIELLTVIACVATAYFAGSWLGAMYGIGGWIIGIILGTVGFVGAYPIFRRWLKNR